MMPHTTQNDMSMSLYPTHPSQMYVPAAQPQFPQPPRGVVPYCAQQAATSDFSIMQPIAPQHHAYYNHSMMSNVSHNMSRSSVTYRHDVYGQQHAVTTTSCLCPACVPQAPVSGYSYPESPYILDQSQNSFNSSFDTYSPVECPMPYGPTTSCQCDGCMQNNSSMACQSSAYPCADARGSPQRDAVVTIEAFERVVGNMYDVARTSGGSSFLQACLKDATDATHFDAIYAELRPHFSELLLDSHGCYVMRSLMERMTPELLQGVLELLGTDDQLVFSLCTHSLHTRRIVQYLLETARESARGFILTVMQKQCKEIATTQQGCIAMQRVMDCATEEQRADMYGRIYESLDDFCHDPFGNYVVQYLLENGEKEETSQKMWAFLCGRVAPLACNKFASNVVEKALHHTTPDLQHNIITELYSNSPDFLQSMLQDSFGNYIVQATIALCSFRDVWMISEKLRPILHTTPYGYKIAARLERRLKGKPLTNARTVSYNQSQLLRS